jgi:ParB-like chromosome segregation protein Spo0J
VVPERVAELAKSVTNVGLQSPIVVRPRAAGEGSIVYEILAGRHRYEAFRLLKRESIPALIQDVDDLRAKLIEIDENLCREGLSPAQEAEAIAHRKQIYEVLNPSVIHGGDRKSTRQTGDLKGIAKPKRFTKITAEATGKAERNVQRAVRRAKRIGTKNLHRIVNSSLDKPAELDALAALNAPEREALIEQAAKGEPVAACQSTSDKRSERWRNEFRHLINKPPTHEDRKWASEELAKLADNGEMPDIPDFLRRDPHARLDTLIRDLSAMRVAESAAVRRSLQERSELANRLLSDAPRNRPCDKAAQ